MDSTRTEETRLDELDALIEAARAAASRAHAPYSRFRVGAAIRSGGLVVSGCNVENASYGLTVCAERNAVAAMVAAGGRAIDAIVIYVETDKSAPPCGACRQVLAEFASADPGRPTRIIMVGRGGRAFAEFATLDELLPRRFEFGPESGGG